jgi:CheY-like chemotaxis protein
MAKTILIIDDEKDMRLYLGTLFRTAGYEVLEAVNGEEGLKTALATPPDLITLDVLMPKKSGVNTYRELRSREKTAKIPIIILTGLANQGDFFGEDFDGLQKPNAIVEKPIDRDKFLAQAREIIGD